MLCWVYLQVLSGAHHLPKRCPMNPQHFPLHPNRYGPFLKQFSVKFSCFLYIYGLKSEIMCLCRVRKALESGGTSLPTHSFSFLTFGLNIFLARTSCKARNGWFISTLATDGFVFWLCFFCHYFFIAGDRDYYAASNAIFCIAFSGTIRFCRSHDVSCGDSADWVWCKFFQSASLMKGRELRIAVKRKSR